MCQGQAAEVTGLFVLLTRPRAVPTCCYETTSTVEPGRTQEITTAGDGLCLHGIVPLILLSIPALQP